MEDYPTWMRRQDLQFRIRRGERTMQMLFATAEDRAAARVDVEAARAELAELEEEHG